MGVRDGASTIRDIAINVCTVPLPRIPACTDCYIQARTLRDVDIWTLESQP